MTNAMQFLDRVFAAIVRGDISTADGNRLIQSVLGAKA
jgi:hypothetical protein